MNILKELLLINESSVFRLYQEMLSNAKFFIPPVFTIALLLEYFNDMDFSSVIKKLLLISIFMGVFYEFHTKAVDLSLESASYTLKKVSPRNLFVKKWHQTKVTTKEKKDWSFLQSIAIPNINDLIATSFFLLAQVFIWLLKLIYSTVYHLTYVFSGVTAILFFLGWTKDALKGTIQASLWCILMPFIIVAILCLVGNSIDETALAGDSVMAKMDTIIWLFGITLLLLISPMITYGMVKGEGVHSFGSKMGSMVVGSGLKAMSILPAISNLSERVIGNSIFKDRFNISSNNKLAQMFKQNKNSSIKDKSLFQNKNRDSNLKQQNSNLIDKSNTNNQKHSFEQSKNLVQKSDLKSSQSKFGESVKSNKVESHRESKESDSKKSESLKSSTIHTKKRDVPKSFPVNQRTNHLKSKIDKELVSTNKNSTEISVKPITRRKENELRRF